MFCGFLGIFFLSFRSCFCIFFCGFCSKPSFSPPCPRRLLFFSRPRLSLPIVFRPPQFSVVFLFGCVLAPTGGCFFGLFSPIVGKSSSSPNNLLLANRFRCTVFRFCRFFSCPLLLFALFAPLPPQPIAPPVHRKRGLPAVRVERRAKKNLGEENNYIRVENGCLITGEKSAICRQENGLSVFPCI